MEIRALGSPAQFIWQLLLVSEHSWIWGDHILIEKVWDGVHYLNSFFFSLPRPHKCFHCILYLVHHWPAVVVFENSENKLCHRCQRSSPQNQGYCPLKRKNIKNILESGGGGGGGD